VTLSYPCYHLSCCLSADMETHLLVLLLASLVTAHPQGGRKGRLFVAEDDFVVVGDDTVNSEESLNHELISVEDGVPRDISGQGRAGFRLLQSDISDIAEVVEANEDEKTEQRFIVDIPRDFSGEGRAGVRLPRPDLSDIAEVVEAGEEDGRTAFGDIPRDDSDKGRAGFKLPRRNVDDFTVIGSAGSEEESARHISDIPRDFSETGKAGPRLLKPELDDLAVVIEGTDLFDKEGRQLSGIPRDFSGEGRAGFKLLKPDRSNFARILKSHPRPRGPKPFKGGVNGPMSKDLGSIREVFADV